MSLMNIIESILFVSGDAVPVGDIADKLGVKNKDILDAAKELQKKYDEESGINLIIFNNKLQFCSNKKYAESVSLVLNPIRERKLTNSMLEVLAIVAYKQPVTRLDLEELRGMSSEYVIQNLISLGLIEVVGRKDAVGRPVLFGTTDKFLKRFQISSLSDLPDYDELLSKIAVLNGNGETYLFAKEEYDESKDPDIIKQNEEKDKENLLENADTIEESDDNGNAVNVKQVPDAGDDAKDEDDFEIVDLGDEEIPDFLKNEDVTVVT